MTTVHVFTLQLTNIDVEDRWLSKNTMQHWWHSVAPNTSRSKKRYQLVISFIYIYTYNHTHIYIYFTYIYISYIYIIIYIFHLFTANCQALALRLEGPQPLAVAVAAPRQRLGDWRRQRLGGRPAERGEQRGHRGGGSLGS